MPGEAENYQKADAAAKAKLLELFGQSKKADTATAVLDEPENELKDETGEVDRALRDMEAKFQEIETLQAEQREALTEKDRVKFEERVENPSRLWTDANNILENHQ